LVENKGSRKTNMKARLIKFSIEYQYDWPYLRVVWEKMVNVLTDTPFEWTLDSTTILPDMNYSKNAKTERWLGTNASLSIRIESSSGNPRDGNAYMVYVNINVMANNKTFTFSAKQGCWDPNLRDHGLDIKGPISEKEEQDLTQLVEQYLRKLPLDKGNETATFSKEKWDEFLKAEHSDFYKEFSELKDELDQVLEDFLSQAESRESTELSALCDSIERFVEIYMDFDGFGRGEYYNLPLVSFSKATRKFLGYARKQGPDYVTGLLERYWRKNNPVKLKKTKIKAKRTKTKAKSTKIKAKSTKPKQPILLPNPRLCPRCKEAELVTKEVQTYRDPHTDSWRDSRMWRCPKCYWRQRVECADSEWSYTPSIIRPDADLGSEVRDDIQRRFNEKKKLGPRVLQGLGKDLSFLFHQEKEIDMALVSYRRRRALHEIEIQLLMALFSRFPKHYKGELKEHWDKTIKKQYQAAWPNLKLRDFLIENPQFDASQKIVLGVRCETCLLECKK
jgi:hypothetical protein